MLLPLLAITVDDGLDRDERALMLFIVPSVQSHLIEVAQNLRGKLISLRLCFRVSESVTFQTSDNVTMQCKSKFVGTTDGGGEKKTKFDRTRRVSW